MIAPGNIEKPADLTQLFAQFLERQAAQWQTADPTEEAGEVSPFQAMSVFAVDPRSAFQQSVEAARLLLPAADAKAFDAKASKPPADWSMIVRNQEPCVAIPFCTGNYPQMMRNVAPLLAGKPLTELRPVKRPGETNGNARKPTMASLADGLLQASQWRLTQQYSAAGEQLAALRKAAPAEWRGFLSNEEAALAWQQGDADRAGMLWKEHPQPEHPVILFNCGVAELFGGRPQAAGPLFTRALSLLPESSSWHDLAQLYRSVVAVASAAR